ncbi:unnamed protein product [Meloidogyne enterolobii]|uniref:Uncharacterized protein n=1 Tax=Meloidogyne enterolobii TaxID=390850 RepID=A0ACB0Y074_MELEN
MDFDAKTLNSFSIASDFTNTLNGGKDPYLMTFDPIAFRYIGRRVVGSSTQRKFTKLGEDFNLCFKLIKSDSKLVKSLLFSYGFLQCSSKNLYCNLIWTNTHLSTNSMRQLKSWQRMNHFPRSWMLTIPDFFCTPLNDKNCTKLVNCCKEIENGKQSPFIVKPAGGSFGKGIFFLSRAEEVYSIDYSQKWVISRYIERPLLINGLKWDLRIYVLVTSFYPLIVYMYSDGLARFAVHTYKDGKTNFDDLNQHLTNYNVFRNNDCSVEDMGHKWTLGALLRHLEENSGIDTELLMVRIEDIVIKSLLSIQPRVAAMCRKLNLHPKCCFELFGFDILVDEHLKPWLLEINLSPSLSCDAPLDTLLKTHLFCDVLNVASIPLVNDRNMENECYFSDEEDEVADEGSKRRKKQSNDEKLDNGNEQDLKNSFHPQTPSTSSLLSTSSVNHFVTLKDDDDVLQQCSSSKNEKEKSKQLPRASKIKRMQTPQKVTFSSERMSALYLERVELLFEKLKLENKRRGHFNRIFPRRTTWRMYCSILEDCGQEQWDKALHTLLSAEYNQDTTPPKLTMYDVQLTHEQLMNAEKYQKRELLDPSVSNIALAEALEEAKCYKKKKVYTTASCSGDFRPYPSALPKLRPSARRRTKSQCLADELKQEKLEKKKEEMAAAATTTTASTSLNISSNSPTAPLLELDPNLPSLSLLKENEGNKFITINENQKMKNKNGVK